MIDDVTKYAQDVVNGKYVVCQANFLACKRHLEDLEKSKTEDFPYYFNVDEAQRIIEFGESLRLAEQNGKEVKLFPFQKFIVGSLMGWLCKDDHSWRYRQSNVSFAKQNGKSFLNGLLITYGSGFTNSPYGQFYISATSQKLSKICFQEICKFIDMDEELQEMYKVFGYKSEILCYDTKATIKALSGDKKVDGIRGIISTIDEMHLDKDDELYNVMKNGQGQLYQSIISIISTAGKNLDYPYYNIYLYSKKILEKKIVDDRMFIFICEIDKDDSWEDKSVYIKANPIYTEKQIDLIYDDFLRQKELGNAKLVDFATKRLNQWCSDDLEFYMTEDVVEKMESENLKIEDYKGQTCVIGLDLSSLGDLTSVSFVFKDWDENGEESYFIKSHSFLPRITFNKFKKKDRKWTSYVKEGSLTVTDAVGGESLDYKVIINYIKEIIDKNNLKVVMLCYDSNNIGGILQDIDETLKLDAMPIKQSMINLTEPTVLFRSYARNGQVKFEKSALYRECLKNAVLIQDFGENKCCKIDKRQIDRKIDAVDATIDAMKFALTLKKKKRINYSKIYEKLKQK